MPPSHQPATLEGQIERVTFRNSETHFMIARLRSVSQKGLVTILGHLPEPKIGETLRVKGYWREHPRYGIQFAVEQVEVLLPTEVEQISRYLSSGLIKGIGTRAAQRLVRHFGDQTLSVIEKDPARMTEVRGIGPKTAEKIAAAWQQHHAVRDLMQFLQDHGLKPLYGARLYKTYGAEALTVLRQDPYRVAEELPGVGFYIADAISRNSGKTVDEHTRARACLRHLLDRACDGGHLFIASNALVERCSSDFELDYSVVQAALESMADENEIRIDPRAPSTPVYLNSLYQAETAIVQRLGAMRTLPPNSMSAQCTERSRIMAMVTRHMAIALSDKQLAALACALEQRLVIITGGPGTGKTTLVRALTEVLEASGQKTLLTAPTGRAARRMAELSGRPAATVHKLLGFNLSEGGFERDRNDPLDTDAVIVDEASMVDMMLMAGLINALPMTARLILVGDVSQLPSVGPGTVLADLIQTGLFETFELEDVFRQKGYNDIIALAHKVRHGEMPVLAPWVAGQVLTEVTFIQEPACEKIATTIVALCRRFIPDQLGLDGIADVQVLAPMHKGAAGTLHLNRVLQKALNPDGKGLEAIGGSYKPGDKVMHLRNNYRKEVFNGDIGTVAEVNEAERRLRVSYDGRLVGYDDADLDELTLAYAITVHKSQGSEYPVVILPLVTQHYVMLQRNLLYTALTRAQRMVIVIGAEKAVRIAIRTDKPHRRRSLLAWRLNPDLSSEDPF